MGICATNATCPDLNDSNLFWSDVKQLCRWNAAIKEVPELNVASLLMTLAPVRSQAHSLHATPMVI
jgi:hypothetical protein